MTTFELLEKWAAYAEYDRDQKRFNLLSENYLFNRCCKNIEAIGAGYDPSGVLSVMYAKYVFLKVAEEKRVPVLSILNDFDSYDDIRAMWAAFHAPEVEEMENEYIRSIAKLAESVTGKPMLGKADATAMKETLFNAVSNVVEGIGKCRVEVYIQGGPIMHIDRIRTHIYYFDKLSECLLALEVAEDGMYLCYISNENSADGYFGFFIKSNGTLMSVNERVDEAFIGQHGTARNARWSENKEYKLFPYDFIFSYSEHDYKGIATKHVIDHEKLAFSRMDPDAYLPLILSMMMLSARYEGYQVDAPVVIVNTLMEANLAAMQASSDTALAIPENSQLVARHKAFVPGYSSDDIRSGAGGAEFCHDWKSNPEEANLACRRGETGVFKKDNPIFVDLYGAGFEFDATDAMTIPSLKALPDPTGDKDILYPEYVGTERRQRLAIYAAGRKQLAEYIREKMFEEYTAFGGIKAVKQWWSDATMAIRPRLIQLGLDRLEYDAICEKYPTWVARQEEPCQSELKARFGEELALVSRFEWVVGKCIPYGMHVSNQFILNREKTTPNGQMAWEWEVTEEPGTTCNRFCVFRPHSWKDIEQLLGTEVPKIVKGWVDTSRGHRGSGNPNLDVVDAVEYVGTPFEDREVRWYSKRYGVCSPFAEAKTEFEFTCAVGMSKRLVNRLMK